MAKYKLSVLAQRDLDKIYGDGLEKFGFKQAILYLRQINEIVKLLSERPEIGRSRDELKQGLFCYTYKSHIIFFRKFKHHIRIVRILYGGMDLMRVIK
ncbi:hypothetical protein MHTCC0001_31670 [Flavobacteriaceae bacterium MHTCC 0001]